MHTQTQKLMQGKRAHRTAGIETSDVTLAYLPRQRAFKRVQRILHPSLRLNSTARIYGCISRLQVHTLTIYRFPIEGCVAAWCA